MRLKKGLISIFATAITTGMILALAGCATHVKPEISHESDHATANADPFENYNRHAFALNQTFDKVLLKPAATVYRHALPWPVRTGVSHFFSNLNEVTSFVSHLLRAEPKAAGITGMRFVINSTVGVFGLVDVASKMRLEESPQDFGSVFAKWGDKHSPYLILPLWGPSTVRDAFGLPFNYAMSVYPLLYPKKLRTQLLLLNIVRFRSELLDAENTIDEASLDRYTFERDAYYQWRNHMIGGDANVTDAVDADLLKEAKGTSAHQKNTMTDNLLIRNEPLE